MRSLLSIAPLNISRLFLFTHSMIVLLSNPVRFPSARHLWKHGRQSMCIAVFRLQLLLGVFLFEVIITRSTSDIGVYETKSLHEELLVCATIKIDTETLTVVWFGIVQFYRV